MHNNLLCTVATAASPRSRAAPNGGSRSALGCDVLPLLALGIAGCPPDGGGRQAELLPAGGGYRAAPAT